jgi:hypothetical protein
MASYGKEYYRKHKADYVARANRHLKKIQQMLRAAKEKPCADCGRQYPFYVMEFDHREGETKLFNISALNGYRRTSMRNLLAEIAKCDLVCANCHRERTYRRGQYRPRKYRVRQPGRHGLESNTLP